MIFFMLLTLTNIKNGTERITNDVHAFDTMEQCQQALKIYSNGNDVFLDKHGRVWRMKFECHKGELG